MNLGARLALALTTTLAGLKMSVLPGIHWWLVAAPVWVPLSLVFLVAPFAWFLVSRPHPKSRP